MYPATEPSRQGSERIFQGIINQVINDLSDPATGSLLLFAHRGDVSFGNITVMEIMIDKIDIKPGRPTIVGKIGKTVVVNLPGNPLASMVNYELFVRAVIRKMSGRTDSYHAIVKTKMKENFSVRGGKYAVVLGRFNGEHFEALKPQMPGMVSPMQEADGFLLITPEIKTLEKERFVNMLPIRWEFCSSKEEDLFT